jgi:hypothetical protein
MAVGSLLAHDRATPPVTRCWRGSPVVWPRPSGAAAAPIASGGDEFVVITSVEGGERVLAAAQAALSERGAGFSIGCSRGSSDACEAVIEVSLAVSVAV